MSTSLTTEKGTAAAPTVTLTCEQFHAITRALSDPRRFSILEQISNHGATACSSLDAQKDISPATISHHIKELTEAGLITVERVGRGSNLLFQRDVYNAYLARLAQL